MSKRPDLELVVEETDRSQAQASAEFRLEQALTATRKHFDGRSERAMLTEQRILEHAWPAKPQRRSLWLLPLVAVFAGSIAFAQELGTLFEGTRARFLNASERADVASPVDRTGARVPEPVRTRSPAGGTEIAPQPSAPPADVAAVRAPARVTSRVAESTAPAPPIPAATSVAEPAPTDAKLSVDEFALYQEAHRAHFVDHDYASALTGWDRYLAAAPRGSFAPEARYNRALALYRLSRTDEAIAALRVFAEGAYGRYRQDEARQLIGSLESAKAR